MDCREYTIDATQGVNIIPLRLVCCFNDAYLTYHNAKASIFTKAFQELVSRFNLYNTIHRILNKHYGEDVINFLLKYLELSNREFVKSYRTVLLVDVNVLYGLCTLIVQLDKHNNNFTLKNVCLRKYEVHIKNIEIEDIDEKFIKDIQELKKLSTSKQMFIEFNPNDEKQVKIIDALIPNLKFLGITPRQFTGKIKRYLCPKCESKITFYKNILGFRLFKCLSCEKVYDRDMLVVLNMARHVLRGYKLDIEF